MVGLAGWGGRIRTSVWRNQNPPSLLILAFPELPWCGKHALFSTVPAWGDKEGGPPCETCGEPGTDGNPLLDVADEQGFTKLHRSCARAWISHQQAAE